MLSLTPFNWGGRGGRFKLTRWQLPKTSLHNQYLALRLLQWHKELHSQQPNTKPEC